MREKILDLCRDHFNSKDKPPFEAGKTELPASGKVVDAEDLVHLVDSSLDMWLTTGRFARDFEKKLATFVQAKGSLLTNSGSSANLVAFSALSSERLSQRKISAGDEVITVAAGFPTTITPIVQSGCIPVFVDVNLETSNIDVNQLEAALSVKTKAVVLAHTLGNPFDINAVKSFCDKHKLFLLEDCCDALGATYNGRHVGTFGEMGTLSFYPAHHITTGEGGAVFSTNQEILDIAASFRDWGRDCWCSPGKENSCGKRYDWQLGDLPEGYDHKYIYSHLGYNLKMTDMQAALGLSQLNKIDSFVAARRGNFALLTAGLEKAGLDEYFILPRATANSDPSWFGFLLTLKDGIGIPRKKIVTELNRRKIGTRLLFAGNILKQPAFKNVPFRQIGHLEHTDKIMMDSFWVGLWPGLGEEHLKYMVYVLSEVMQSLTATKGTKGVA